VYQTSALSLPVAAKQQVCVQPPTSADNVALLAFAADCYGGFAAATPGGCRYRSTSPAHRTHTAACSG